MPHIDEYTDLDKIFPPESWITPRVTIRIPMPPGVIPPIDKRKPAEPAQTSEAPYTPEPST